MATVLTELGDVTLRATDGLFVADEDAERTTGWRRKPPNSLRMHTRTVRKPRPSRKHLFGHSAGNDGSSVQLVSKAR